MAEGATITYGAASQDVSQDPRLRKADSLLHLLRSEPASTTRSIDDLARAYDLAPSIVEELLRSEMAFARHRFQMWSSIKRGIGEFFGVIKGAADGLLSKPHAFLVVTLVISLCIMFGAKYVLHAESEKVMRDAIRGSAGLAMLLIHMVCYYRHAEFKLVAFGASFFGLIFAAATAVSSFGEVQPEPFNTAFGRAFLYVIAGLVFGMLYALASALATALGGAVKIREARARRMQLSRHELLARMFQLQERLSKIPERAPGQDVWWLTWVKSRTHQTAFVVAAGFSGVAYVAGWVWHVTTNDARNVPPIFILFSMGLFFGWLAAFGVIAIGANTFKKVLSVVAIAGIVDLLFGVLPSPASPMSLAKSIEALASVGLMSVFRLGYVGLVRLGIYLTRELKRLRLAEDTDEASLVAEFLEIRRRLATTPVSVTVLVIDAVGSTKMKEGGDPLTVEYTFRMYQQWLSDIVREHGGRVVAQTGDGAIVAFGDAHAGLRASRAILSGLDDFNATQNRLATPFRLRLAMHRGDVIADLDQVQFASVIDVAAHAEKASPVGGIAVTEPEFEALGRPSATKLAADIDGFGVYVLEMA